MPFVDDFDELWKRYQERRKISRDMNPEGNRCAATLGLALSLKFKPRTDSGETSFRDVTSLPEGMRGQPFLDKFYVKAEEMAKRLEKEFGPPDLYLPGRDALDKIEGVKGIIFVENAWPTLLFQKTVDHIDLWDGHTTAGYTEEADYIRDHIKGAEWIWLWKILPPVGKAASAGQ